MAYLRGLFRTGATAAVVAILLLAIYGLWVRYQVEPLTRDGKVRADIVPVAGDLVGALLGCWLIWEARSLGLSKWQVARMGGNVAIDTLLGAIPWVGAVPDFFFRSNSRNLRIIRKHLDRHHPQTQIIDM